MTALLKDISKDAFQQTYENEIFDILMNLIFYKKNIFKKLGQFMQNNIKVISKIT